jgi:hypothetical protein
MWVRSRRWRGIVWTREGAERVARPTATFNISVGDLLKLSSSTVMEMEGRRRENALQGERSGVGGK